MLLCVCILLLALAGCDQAVAPDEHEHVIVEHEGQEPDCINDGWIPYVTCSECDEYSTYLGLDALGHSYSLEYEVDGDVHTRSCTRCSDVITESHIWNLIETVNPTCTTEGTRFYECSFCKAESSESISMLGHKYEEDEPLDDVQTMTCSVCNTTVVSHNHEWITYEIIAEPTCTLEGEKYLVCTICFTKKSEVIAVLNHDFSEEYAPNGDVHSLFCSRCPATTSDTPHDWQFAEVITSPTCTDTGVELLVCSVCSAEKSGTLSALNHDFSEEYAPNGDVHSLFCSRCTATTSDMPHDWQSIEVVTAPTCTEEGLELLVCSVCSAEKSGTLSALNHDFSEEYAPNGDVHSLFCSRCTATSSDTPHDWQSIEVVTAPTCTEEGIELLVCSVCSAEKSGTLSALNHDFSEEYAPNGDVHSLFCSRCPATTSDMPHDWQSFGIVKAPNCEEEGEELFICSVCDDEKTEVLPISHASGEWVIVTQATALTAGSKLLRCSSCKAELRTERIAPDVESMPIIYLEGEYEKATAAKNEVDMIVTYVGPDGEEFEAYATIKVQGSSSAAYDKKNYTIKLYKDEDHDSKFKYDFGWGKESKYVMKANWVDFSQARNVVSCRLWGNIVTSRKTSENQQRLAALSTNGGAIDGFPIAVYMNGVFHGLYTMNVPKDEWMFGMGEKDENGNKSTTEALIAADDWNHTDFYSFIEGFKEDSAGDLMAINGGWELRYYGGDDYAWVAESFDALIKFCQDNDGDAFKAGIANYLDVDAAIDYVIFMYANSMRDNASKNMLWATYDGKTWIPSVYDQDGTFGQVWDGVRFQNANLDLPSVKNGRIDVGIGYGPSGNNVPKFILWDRIWNTFTAEILARYAELRLGALSTENMINEFKSFEALIPESMFDADLERWQASRDSWWAGKKMSTPYDYTEYHYDYIYQWISDRMTYLDQAMQNISNYYYSS